MKKMIGLIIVVVLVSMAAPTVANAENFFKKYLPPLPPPFIFGDGQYYSERSSSHYEHGHERRNYEHRVWVRGHWEYRWEYDYLRGRYPIKVWIPGHWEYDGGHSQNRRGW